MSRYCQLYGGFPDVDKKQDGILKSSLQKRWVCGRSPEQRLREPRFGSGLPVGCYTNHLEKGFWISVPQSFGTVLGSKFPACRVHQQTWGPEQEPQKPAEEGTTEESTVGTL